MATRAADAAGILAHLPVESGVAAVSRGGDVVVACEPCDVVRVPATEAFAQLDALADGWWMVAAAFELGRAVERVRGAEPEPGGPPDLLLARFDARLVLPPTGPARLEGAGAARVRLSAALDRAGDRDALAPPALTGWTSTLDRDEFGAGVRAVVALIEAGDVYQVNLTRRLRSPRTVDPRALFAALARHNPAPHACLLAVDGEAIVSASPERFLAWQGPAVETRPIKGTAATLERLRASPKDRAENVMIVDLARNDLGRVCEYGSVDVPALCEPEVHPGLVHLVSTVRGTLRPGVGRGALLRATFPPASVTGAPKPRVLQAIADLEPVPRGVYCGALGWIRADDDPARDAGDLAVAIRTFRIGDAGTDLGVGAGITADSDPVAEWEETELKAARLLAAAGSGCAPEPAQLVTGAGRR